MRKIVNAVFAPFRKMRDMLHSDEDMTAVYGEHPNGNRDEENVGGNIAANVIGRPG
jgi:hypothetical protein